MTKKIQGEKINQTWFFSSSPVLMRFQWEGMLCSAYHKTFITPKGVEIGNSDRIVDGSTPT